MSSTWKLKFWGFALAFALSVYLLLPSFLGVNDKRATLTKQGKPLPWHLRLLPAKELNLGLDLRGGLYLEMEIALEEAIKHRVDFLVGDVKARVLSDFAGATATHIPGNRLRIEAEKEKIPDVQQKIVAYFGNEVFLIRDEAQELIFSSPLEVEEARKKAYAIVQVKSGYRGDVSLSQDGKFLFVSFSNERERLEMATLFSEKGREVFKDVTDETENVTYLSVRDEYVNTLKRDIVEQAAKSVRNRIDRYGVAEAAVSRQSSDRLVVELPGVKDPEAIIDIIRRTGKLEFRLVDNAVSPQNLKEMFQQKAEQLLLDKVYQREALQKINEALKPELKANTEIALQLNRHPQTGEVTSYVPYLLETQVTVTGDMLDNASVQTDNGLPVVAMSFNKEGAKKFAELTSQNVGRFLAIVLDGTVNSAPRIQGAIYGGSAQINLGMGRFEDLMQEARDIVLVLKEGALPATLTVGTKNVIGPTLGKDSVEAGLKSLLIAAAAVVVFMLLYYKLGGLIANFALLANVLFIFAILTLFGASLTLPGIAGIVLTMGMAVDANVIIFERMREEKYLGGPIAAVVDSGYKNAMSAIVDGNITTFISGLVLFQFGTGPIKGFATTLMIGIVTTMLTAIVLTRALNDWLIQSVKLTDIRI